MATRLPIWTWVWLAISVLWLLLRAVGTLRSLPLCVFLIAMSASVCYAVERLLPADRSRLTLTFRRVVLALLVAGIPVLVDPTTAEAVNVARFALIVTAAVALVASWVVDRVWTGRWPRWINGLQWPVLAMLLWLAISTLVSEDRRVSLLGAYGSYHGLILIAALVVIEIAVSDAFRLDDLPDVMRTVGVASIPVVVYGLIQFHDQLFSGGHWEFIPWQTAQPHAFSTFGNPDHLAGYLATVLGVTVVGAVMSRRTLRYVLAVTAALSLVVLAQTSGRGGWLGAFVVAVVLLVAYRRSVLAHPRAAAGAGLVAALGVLVFVLGAHRIVGTKLSTLFSVGGGSSVAERFGYWGAAFHAGSHHLLTGTGPDTYSIVYQRYQSRSLATSIGVNGYVNGAHDIFMNTFSEQGVIGLVCLIGLLAIALWWTVAAWRRGTVRRREGVDGDVLVAAPVGTADLRKAAPVALFAALAAYVAQASFDTLQVGTEFHFWLLLGLLGSLLSSTWPAEQLWAGPWTAGHQIDPTAPLRAEDDETLMAWEPRTATARRRSPRRPRVPGWVPVAVAGGLAAVTVTAWRDTAPWRADHSYWAASRATTNTAIVSHLIDARATNPWEPTYDETLGQLALNTVRGVNGASRLVYLNRALTYLGDAARLQPLNPSVALNYAQALVLLAELQPSARTIDRASLAVDQAAKDDPLNAEISTLFSTLKKLPR